MHSASETQMSDMDGLLQRGRALRSAEAIALFAGIGRAAREIVERAFVRPYRMVRTPGCGCEA